MAVNSLVDDIMGGHMSKFIFSKKMGIGSYS